MTDNPASLVTRLIQRARVREAAERLPDCVEHAQDRLNEARVALTDIIEAQAAEIARLRAIIETTAKGLDDARLRGAAAKLRAALAPQQPGVVRDEEGQP